MAFGIPHTWNDFQEVWGNDEAKNRVMDTDVLIIDEAWVILGLFWGCFGVILGLFWGYFGVILGLFSHAGIYRMLR